MSELIVRKGLEKRNSHTHTKSPSMRNNLPENVHFFLFFMETSGAWGDKATMGCSEAVSSVLGSGHRAPCSQQQEASTC